MRPVLTASLTALHHVPPSSVASYLSTIRMVRIACVLSWTAVGQTAWLLEARVRPEVRSEATWGDWEAVAPPIHATQHTVPLEPGLCYEFRVATLSDDSGQGMGTW